jgi:hypothetical protein
MVATMHREVARSTFALALAGSLLFSAVPAGGSAVPAAGSLDSQDVPATYAATGIASVRFLVVPLRVTGGSIPSQAALVAMARREVMWLRRASFGKVTVEGRVAPGFDARPYEDGSGSSVRMGIRRRLPTPRPTVSRSTEPSRSTSCSPRQPQGADGSARWAHTRAVFDPPISRTQAEAPVLPVGGLTFAGTTDPALAGTAWKVDNQAGGIVAPDGSFSGVVHPPFGGLYQINISVLIGRQPDGLNLDYEEFRGIVRT